MKKLLAVILALTMLLCSLTALADNALQLGHMTLNLPEGLEPSISENGTQQTATVVDGTTIYIFSSAPFEFELDNDTIYRTVEQGMYNALDPNYAIIEEHVVMAEDNAGRMSIATINYSGKDLTSLFFCVRHNGYLTMVVAIDVMGTTDATYLDKALSWVEDPTIFKTPLVYMDAE